MMDKQKAIETKTALLDKLKELNINSGQDIAMGELVIDALDLLFSIAIAGAFNGKSN